MPPLVVAVAPDPAEQLPLHRVQPVAEAPRPDALVLVPHRDPPVRVAEEHRLARVIRVVVRPRVPQPPVEHHHVAWRGGHLDRAVRFRPRHVPARRPGDPVGPVAARHHLEVPPPGLRHVREPVRQLHRQPGPRVGLELPVLPPAVLVPLEPERPGRSQRRVHVKVGVVHVDVPAEHRPHVREGGGMIDKPGRLRAVRHRAQPVQRSADVDLAARLGPQVHLVKRVTVAVNLVRRQRPPDDGVPVPVELRQLLSDGGHHADISLHERRT